MFATAVVVTASLLVIRKVFAWRSVKSDSALDDFFTDRLSYILTFQDPKKIDALKASFAAMLARSSAFGKFSRKRKRESARLVMLRMVGEIVGENREFAERLYDEFGFSNDAIKELRDHRWWKRAEAVRELTVMHVKKASGNISELLSDSSSEVKTLAFEGIIEMEGIGFLPVLAGMLRDLTTWNEINFARIIGERRNEAAPNIFPLLRHTDVTVRSFAVRMLGVLRAVDAVPALIRIAGTGNPTEATEAIVALGLIGDERAVDVCTISLGSRLPAVRMTACKALGAFGSPGSVGSLAPLMEDVASEVRLAAGEALLKCGSEGVRILESLSRSQSAVSCRAARHVLDERELAKMTAT